MNWLWRKKYARSYDTEVLILERMQVRRKQRIKTRGYYFIDLGPTKGNELAKNARVSSLAIITIIRFSIPF